MHIDVPVIDDGWDWKTFNERIVANCELSRNWRRKGLQWRFGAMDSAQRRTARLQEHARTCRLGLRLLLENILMDIWVDNE